MKRNLHPADRFVRILLAIVMGLLVLMNIITGSGGIILLMLTGEFLLTGIIGFCPLYSLFDLQTISEKKTTADPG